MNFQKHLLMLNYKCLLYLLFKKIINILPLIGGPCDIIPTLLRSGFALICGTMILAPGKFLSALRRFAKLDKKYEIDSN